MQCVALCLLALAALASARPEPPVNQQFAGYSTTHQDRFSPPPSPHHHQDDYSSNSISVQSARSQLNAPSSQYGAPSAPSSQYGAPASQYSAPSSQYGAPASQYSAPSSQYGAPARRQYSTPSSQYGAPARRQYSAPSSQYGAPARSSHSRASSHRSSAPARSYGAPAQTAAVFLSAQPAAQYGAPSASYGAPAQAYGAPDAGYAYGKNAVDDDLSEPANYEFSYDVQAAPEGGEFGHRESRQGDVTRGSYEVLLPDGRKQIVEYEADAEGFRPTIRYEDVGGPYPAAGQGAGGPY